MSLERGHDWRESECCTAVLVIHATQPPVVTLKVSVVDITQRADKCTDQHLFEFDNIYSKTFQVAGGVYLMRKLYELASFELHSYPGIGRYIPGDRKYNLILRCCMEHADRAQEPVPLNKSRQLRGIHAVRAGLHGLHIAGKAIEGRSDGRMQVHNVLHRQRGVKMMR